MGGPTAPAVPPPCAEPEPPPRPATIPEKEPSIDTPLKAWAVKEVLDKKIRLLLKDGRVYEGALTCLDNLGNMILHKTQHMNAGYKKDEKNMVGMVLVPGKLIERIWLPETCPPPPDE